MSLDDDAQVGWVLSRREALTAFGAAGAAMAVPTFGAESATGAGRLALPACVARPAQTEGPYFVDTRLNRSDVRSDPTDGAISEGAPLHLTFQVSRMTPAACSPLVGAVVDIWQCDGIGVYSGFKDINGQFDTTGKQFLRGHQRTNADGVATFVTIYPGWYSGRAVHIHFKIRTDPDAARGGEFTSQMYFKDSVSNEVFLKRPYRDNQQRRVVNKADGFYRTGGSRLMLDVAKRGTEYHGTFDIGLVS